MLYYSLKNLFYFLVILILFHHNLCFFYNMSVCLGVSSSMSMSVYEQGYDTSPYIYTTGLPDLTQLTLCVWIHALNNDFRGKFIFTISSPCEYSLSVGFSFLFWPMA